MAVLLSGVGCSSQSIQRRYSVQLQQLVLNETTVKQFQKVFPEAYVGGQSHDLTAYVVGKSGYSPFAPGADPWTGMVDEQLYFYFRDGILVQWGRPRDWKSDIDVTVRQR